MISKFPKDKYKRPIKDLRISVTDRCNFRCNYCMPAEIFGESYKFVPTQDLLSFEEIERMAKIFAKLGVNKIVFDKSGYKYHGRLKEFADALRDKGFNF